MGRWLALPRPGEGAARALRTQHAVIRPWLWPAAPWCDMGPHPLSCPLPSLLAAPETGSRVPLVPPISHVRRTDGESSRMAHRRASFPKDGDMLTFDSLATVIADVSLLVAIQEGGLGR
jgi:hypothetical protein